MSAAPSTAPSAGWRWRATLGTEWRIQVRSGIPLGAAATTLGWVVLMRLVPAAARPTAAAWVLLVEVTALGFFVAPALVAVERDTGVAAATALTRWRPAQALAVRLAVLATWTSAAGTAITVAGDVGDPVPVLVGVVATTLLLALASLAALGRAHTLTAWIPRVPVVAVPLLVPTLVAATGLSDHPALALSPLTGAWGWLSGSPSGVTLGWAVACIAAAAWWVLRIGWALEPADDAPVATTGSVMGWVVPPAVGVPRWRRRLVAVRSQARVDRRTLGGDRLAAMLVGGVPIIAVGVRVATDPLVAWVDARWGVDLAAHLPALWAFLLVAHTTTMFGAVTGLLLLEDRDAGLEPATATTRAGLGTVLAWRLGATGVVTGLAVAAALAIAGARPAAGVVGLAATAIAAGVTSAVPALALATFARDRAAGMVAMKALSLPLYLPVLWWLVDGPAGWAFGLVPTAWPARALWAEDTGGALVALALAVVTSAVVVVPLARRFARHVVA